MKRIFIIALVACFGIGLFGQQIPSLTQYYFNHYSVNPAATGISEGLPLAFSYRKLWSGIEESPSVQYLSGNMLFADAMAGGIKIFNSTAGPLKKTGVELTYSYHLELNTDLKLAFGLSGLIYQFSLSRSDLTFEYQDDPVLLSGADKMIVPDASFGTYLYADDFYVGLSVPQMIGRNIDLKSDNILQEKQVRHYYLLGGYNYPATRDLMLKPSVLVKFIEAGLYQVDINAIVEFKETFLGGISFRSSDALIFQVGFRQDELLFGYSYDLPIAGAKGASFGSHEIFVQYLLPSLIQ